MQIRKGSTVTDWCESVREHFLSLGFRQSFADPLLKRLIMSYQAMVSDCIFVGDANDPAVNACGGEKSTQRGLKLNNVRKLGSLSAERPKQRKEETTDQERHYCHVALVLRFVGS